MKRIFYWVVKLVSRQQSIDLTLPTQRWTVKWKQNKKAWREITGKMQKLGLEVFSRIVAFNSRKSLLKWSKMHGCDEVSRINLLVFQAKNDVFS